MGFRELHGFNLALLGKQGWNLLTNSDALVAKIYKAKYYPNGDFLSAEEGSNPSFVWKGIWKVRIIIKEGYRWRVGNGARINIWQDPWLRGVGSRWITSDGSVGDSDRKVDELIDPETREWKISLLQSQFNHEDCKAIMEIPLMGDADCVDKIIWPLSKNGFYTVKSGYRLLTETLTNSAHLHVPGNWQALWRLQMPPKMRMMGWILAREVVPTRDMLQHSHILVPWECGLCGQHIENSWHLFINCEVARSCWAEAGLLEKIESSSFDQEGFVQWLFSVIESAS
ncbi:Putative ribonuclease H protein At1g65750 [Linum perenne]